MIGISLANTAAQEAEVVELVRILCEGVSSELVLQQGLFIAQEIENYRNEARKKGVEIIPSEFGWAGLLYEPEDRVEASVFEVAGRVLAIPDVWEKAEKISPETHPLTAFTVLVVATHQGAKPKWVSTEALNVLRRFVAEKAQSTSQAVRNIMPVIPMLTGLAKRGEKFQSKGRGKGKLRKWLEAQLRKEPKAKSEQIWATLKKTKPNWVTVDRGRGHRELWIDGASQSWGYFLYLISTCRREIKKESQAQK